MARRIGWAWPKYNSSKPPRFTACGSCCSWVAVEQRLFFLWNGSDHRLLQGRGRARVHRRMPFVIRLVDRRQAECTVQPLTVKFDPGSRFTGIALGWASIHSRATIANRCGPARLYEKRS
ncbi:RRXRR domain-containing protein [Azotobacter armeniacus]